MENPIIRFDAMSEASLAAVCHRFSQAGAPIVQAQADATPRRKDGITFRSLSLSFADNQRATLYMTASNEIYRADVNGETVLFDGKEQGDVIDAVVRMLDSGRARYQALLAKVRAPLPDSIVTAAPKMEAALRQQVDDINAAIAATEAEIARYA
jgi:hypothetical protein